MTVEKNSGEETQAGTPLTAGSSVAQYRVDSRIGSGGMGEVYLARDTRLDPDVALKFLSHHLIAHDDFRARFLIEARAAAKLSHPNIITIHEVGEYQGRPYFVMELVEGQSLKHFVPRHNLTAERLLELVMQILSGLQAAHEKNITHRDIKPDNILIDMHGRVRIVDFGLAAVKGAHHLTRTGSTLGTVGYMSPEQAQGKTVDHRTDLFSASVVMYELISGKNPFIRENLAATLHAITHDEVPPLPETAIGYSPQLAEIIMKLLNKDPLLRYQDAATVCADLQKISKALARSETTENLPPSIAVLPFSNLSSDADQAYFCDGIAEDIISDLTHVPGLRVVARTSAFAFRDHSGDIRVIGQKLGVAYVLEGSVRKSGNRLRISAQLIEVASGYHLWSDKYDRELADIFAIQDEIAHAIVNNLKLKLGEHTSARKPSPGVPVEAYQLYSRGRYELNHRTPEGFRLALKYFSDSAALAPGYAPAQVGIADTCLLMFAYDLVPPRDAIARGRIAALRARELEETLADAHVAMGGIHTYYDWAWHDAEQEFLRALNLSPGHAVAHQWYGELLTHLGRYAEAEHHLRTAISFDPLSAVAFTMLGNYFVRRRQPQEALVYLDQAIALGSTNDFTYALAGWSYASLGRFEDGFRLLARGRELSEGSIIITALTGLIHDLTHNVEGMRAALEHLQAQQQGGYVAQPYFAAMQVLLGDEAGAAACLREALRRHDSEMIFMSTMPYYDRVRENPRLNQLISVLDLPAH